MMPLRLNLFFFFYFFFFYIMAPKSLSFQGKKMFLISPLSNRICLRDRYCLSVFLHIVCRRTALSMIWIAISIHVSHLI